jgi:hypothetical protein
MNAPKLTLQELKNIHPVESIAPYGIVLIIPSQEFNRNEIADLTEENKIIYSNYQGKSSVFIKLPLKQPLPTVENSSRPKNEDTTAQPAAAPHIEVQQPTVTPTAITNKRTQKTWSQAENDLLTLLYTRENSFKDIVTKLQMQYPNRTENAIRCAANALNLTLRPEQMIRPKKPKTELKTQKQPMTAIVQARSAKGGDQWKNVWQIEEDKLLIELWNQKPRLKVKEIGEKFCPKYPKRTQDAIENRITELQREKRIESRFHIKNRKTKKQPKHWNNIKEQPETKKPEDKTEEQDAFKTIIEAYEDLNKKYTAIKNDLDNVTSSKAYIEVKTELDNLTSFVQTNLSIKYQLENLQRDFIRHKHIKETGEAAISLRDQK